jgi:hypothetical protein
MAIYLCSYKEFTAKQGPTRLPVRTSIGYPRHPPAYRDEMVNLKELHPNKEWLWPKGLPEQRSGGPGPAVLRGPRNPRGLVPPDDLR